MAFFTFQSFKTPIQCQNAICRHCNLCKTNLKVIGLNSITHVDHFKYAQLFHTINGLCSTFDSRSILKNLEGFHSKKTKSDLDSISRFSVDIEVSTCNTYWIMFRWELSIFKFPFRFGISITLFELSQIHNVIGTTLQYSITVKIWRFMAF